MTDERPTNLNFYGKLPREVQEVAHRIKLQSDSSFPYKRLLQTIPMLKDDSEMEGKTYYLGEDVVHQKRRRKRGVGLNAKQRKKLFELSKCEFKYETFKKINELWHSYIDSVINNFDSEKDQIKLIHADFHGAYFVVSASLNPVLVGCKGFVVQETKNTFRLINQENKLLTIPKHGTIFAFKHKEVVTKLNGSALRLNSFARTKIRMKMRNSFDVI